MKRPCIAIDGPVAAGKSTVARLIARELGFTYIDSGAMYRALAWAAQREGATADSPERVLELLSRVEIALRPRADGLNQVLVGGRDVTSEIRSPEIGQLASELSALPAVRERMVALQREMAREGGVVMEGRDIQTVVLKDAEVKVFLTAPAEERARRRWLEFTQQGLLVTFDEVLRDVRARDERDSKRAHSPLTAAPDAVELDSGGLSVDAVAAKVLDVVRERAGWPPAGR